MKLLLVAIVHRCWHNAAPDQPGRDLELFGY